MDIILYYLKNTCDTLDTIPQQIDKPFQGQTEYDLFVQPTTKELSTSLEKQVRQELQHREHSSVVQGGKNLHQEIQRIRADSFHDPMIRKLYQVEIPVVPRKSRKLNPVKPISNKQDCRMLDMIIRKLPSPLPPPSAS
jgi:hypothetical protein